MFRRPLTRTALTGVALLAASLLAPGDARAEEFDEAFFVANNVWIVLSAALVFMNRVALRVPQEESAGAMAGAALASRKLVTNEK